MPKVFISYRARAHAGYAALLDHALASRFGGDMIFYASRSIAPGDDFVQAILGNLRQCSVLLAIIGAGWLPAAGDWEPDSAEGDWVRREIAEALANGVRVIPVLVESAAMPREADLPDDIRALSRCQYLRIHHREVDDGIARIVAEIDGLLSGLHAGSGQPRPLDGAAVQFHRVAASYRPVSRIGIITGTIRNVQCAEIWVNSENTDMEMSRCTDYSISGVIRYFGAARDAAGRVVTDDIANELAVRVGKRRPVAPGTTFVTSAGQLAISNNVQYIIHVAAVRGEPGFGYQQVQDVGRCVTNVLTTSEQLVGTRGPVRSILFPLLGVGVGAADPWRTARAMVSAAASYLERRSRKRLRTIYFLAHKGVEQTAIADAIAATPGLVPESGAARYERS